MAFSAGSARGRAEIPTHSSTSELWAIYVDPKHWRRGVGQRLWDEVEDQLRRSGFSDVTLWVLQDNGGALAFYRSNGFVVERIQRTIELGGTELVEIPAPQRTRRLSLRLPDAAASLARRFPA